MNIVRNLALFLGLSLAAAAQPYLTDTIQVTRQQAGGTTIFPTYSLQQILQQFNTSPALTGIPTAPTPALTDNSTTLATTAYVQGNTAQNRLGAFTGLNAVLSAGNTSATLELFGDSTLVNEAPYLASAMAALYPAYTVNYRLLSNTGPYLPTCTTDVQVGPNGRLAWVMSTAMPTLDNAEIPWPAADFEIRVRLFPVNGASSWTTTGSHICFLSSLNGSSKGILLHLDDSNNKLLLEWNNNGTLVQTFSTVAPNTISAITSATDIWIRATAIVNNGSSQNVVAFYYATDGGVNWTQIGTTVTNSGATVNTNSSAVWNLGGVPGGQLCTAFNISGIEIRNGVQGVSGDTVQILNPLNLAAWYPSVTGGSCTLTGSPTLELVANGASGQSMGFHVTNFNIEYVRGGPTWLGFQDGFNATQGWEDFVSTANGVPQWTTMYNDIFGIPGGAVGADPTACLTVIIENPVGSTCISPQPQVQFFRNAKQRAWATSHSAKYVDVEAAFLANPLWNGGVNSTLMNADQLHPSIPLGATFEAQTIANAVFYGK